MGLSITGEMKVGMYEYDSVLDSKRWCKVFEILFAVCIMLGALGDSNSLPSSLKVLSLLAIALGVIVLFVTGDFRRLKKIASFFGVYGFVLLGILVWSVFLWIMNMETISFITRGAMKFMYQFFVLLIISAGAYMLGERAIHGVFYGLAAANLIIVLWVDKCLRKTYNNGIILRRHFPWNYPESRLWPCCKSITRNPFTFSTP